jgi:hypothetical protein
MTGFEPNSHDCGVHAGLTIVTGLPAVSIAGPTRKTSRQ